MINKVKYLNKTIREIRNFPLKTIVLGNDEAGNRLYKNFNARHPRVFIIRKKTIGVALIDKSSFANAGDWLKSVSGKNSAAYYSRKAAGAGCTFTPINPNDYVDAIHQIHLSAENRQGRKMDQAYTSKITDYPVDANNSYFGVLKDGELIAYLWIVMSGELLLMNRIMGHSDHLDHGTMYLLVTAFVQHAFSLPAKIIMYDTLLGGGEGLKLFKKRCGFKPYRVQWKKAR